MEIVTALAALAIAAYVVCDTYKRIKAEVSRHKSRKDD